MPGPAKARAAKRVKLDRSSEAAMAADAVVDEDGDTTIEPEQEEQKQHCLLMKLPDEVRFVTCGRVTRGRQLG